MEKELEQEEAVALMPDTFTSVKELIDRYEEEHGAEEENRTITVQDASGNELGFVSYVYRRPTDLTEITRGDGMQYELSYNDAHGLTGIKIEGVSVPLIQYTGKQKSIRIHYGNGDTLEISYDGRNEINTVTWRDREGIVTARYRYEHNEGGLLVRKVDILQGTEYTYYYENGDVIRIEVNSVSLDRAEEITTRQLKKTIRYTYNAERKLIKTCIRDASGKEEESCYAGEAEEKQVVFSPDTGLTESISFASGRKLSYEYDEEKRITQVQDSEEGVTTYCYDTLGQLCSETKNGVTTEFQYDAYGNLTAKGEDVYRYEDEVWRDKLTGFGGTDILYDAGGNPISYRGYAFAWERGRQLKLAVGNGKVVSYCYNDRGIRTSKKVNHIKHEYMLKGKRILRECYGHTTIDFLYDKGNEISGLRYQGENYYFYRNLQGDVIGITDENGVVKATYAYDAWGSCTVTSDTSGVDISAVNPFRYRGYYYDTETGFYYLESRYYDPVTGRFLNADDPGILLSTVGEYFGVNLFTYCCNDPINRKDPTGRWGPSIHYGKEQNGQWLYGTVKWAMDCGMSEEDAKIVGHHNNYVDNFWSFTGAGTWTGNGRHFNEHDKEPELLDSRISFLRMHYQNAIALWKESTPGSSKRAEALEELGVGLHSLQDYYAHLDYWKYEFWKDEVDWFGGSPHYSYSYDAYESRGVLEDWNQGYFDNEDYDIIGPFSNGEYFHKYVGKENSWRYKDTRRDTIEHIRNFIQTTCYSCC